MPVMAIEGILNWICKVAPAQMNPASHPEKRAAVAGIVPDLWESLAKPRGIRHSWIPVAPARVAPVMKACTGSQHPLAMRRSNRLEEAGDVAHSPSWCTRRIAGMPAAAALLAW